MPFPLLIMPGPDPGKLFPATKEDRRIKSGDGDIYGSPSAAHSPEWRHQGDGEAINEGYSSQVLPL
jgi:hypothetical protein